MRICTFLLFLLTSTSVFAQTSDSLRRVWLTRRLDSLQTIPLLQNGSIAASLTRVRTGQSVLVYNAQRTLPPASTMKLITTATALAVLNENYTYQTVLEYDGLIRNDTLVGNLRLRGVGDPSLASGRFPGFPNLTAQLALWVKAVKDAKIRAITGRVLADDGIFDENYTPGGWPYDDLGNYYGAGASGLMINENSYKLIFKPADTLYQPARILRTEPVIPYLAFDNRVRTDAAGTGDQSNIFASPTDRRAFIEGFIPMGVPEFSIKGSLPDPAYFVALSLQTNLIAVGISVGEQAASLTQLRRQSTPFFLTPAAGILHRQPSPPLRDLIRECNFQSINLYAEALLKTVGATLNYGGTTRQGINALKQVWRAKGVNLTGFRPLDGSGLSPQSGLTTQNMTDVLVASTRETWFPAFYAAIPVMGVSGTVRTLGRRTRAAGNVRAKSGSIGGVRCYAGYFTARNGEVIAFSFMFNQYDPDAGSATQELEKLMVGMAEF